MAPDVPRRTVIGSIAAVATAGCLTAVGRDLPIRETEAPNPRISGGQFSSDATTFAAFAIGDRDAVLFPADNGPHSVWIGNDAAVERNVPLRIEVGAGGAIFERSLRFPADGIASFDLLEPAWYRFVLARGDGRELTTVEKSRFDCNASATDVTIDADWGIESTAVTTDMGCPPTSGLGSPV